MAKGTMFRRLILLVLLIVIAVFAVSWFMTRGDEELSPEAQAWLTQPAEASADSMDNAYFYLLGFTAPQGTNPMELGRAISTANRERMNQGDFSAIFSSTLTETQALTFVGAPEPFAEEFMADTDAIMAMAQDNAELMRRYAAMIELPHFQPGPDVDTLVPESADMVKCHALYQALYLINIQGPDPASAVVDLARETAFWRMTAAQSHMLLFKILAMNAMMSNSTLVSQTLNAIPDLIKDPRVLEAVMAMTAPATAEELDWTPIYVQRYRDLSRLLASPPPLSQMGDAGQQAFGSNLLYALLRPLLAEHATLNRAQALYECRSAAATNPPSLDAAFAACTQQLTDYSAWSMDSLSNPFGRRMLLLAQDDYSQYVREFHMRFNLLPRMVRAWALMLSSSVSADQAQEFLDSLGNDARDPFTGRPFEYDPEQQAIVATNVTLSIEWPQTDSGEESAQTPQPDSGQGQAPEPAEAPAQ